MAGYVDFKRMGAPPIPVVQIEFVALAGGREVGSGYIPIPGNSVLPLIWRRSLPKQQPLKDLRNTHVRRRLRYICGYSSSRRASRIRAPRRPFVMAKFVL